MGFVVVLGQTLVFCDFICLDIQFFQVVMIRYDILSTFIQHPNFFWYFFNFFQLFASFFQSFSNVFTTFYNKIEHS